MTLSVVVLILSSISLGTFILYSAYQVYFSPLARVPSAHPVAPLTRLWIIWQRYSGREHRTRLLLHRQKGAVIRLGPNELGFDCIENGVTTVYNGAFDKNDWYQPFDFFRERCMFTMINSAPHRERRRMMTHVFSKSYILQSPDLDIVLDTVLSKRFLKRVNRWAQDATEVDLRMEAQAISMDVTSNYLCGIDAGSNFVEDTQSRDYYLDAFTHTLDGLTWHDFPGVLRKLGKFGLYPLPASRKRSLEIVEKLCSDMCDVSLKLYREYGTSTADINKARESGQFGSWPVVYSQLRSHIEPTCSSENELQRLLGAELLDQMIAGNHATSNTISFLIWQLSRHTDAQRKLRDEFLNTDSTISAKDLDSLPFVEAVLMETMRLHPGIPGPHWRVVPKGGTQIGNFKGIPEGTLLSATVWTMSQNERVFPEPASWVPDRWLDEENAYEMRKWFFTFGAGNRVCIAHHLARRVLKSSLYSIYSRFETSLTGDFKMVSNDGHMGTPNTNLRVVFRAFKH